MIVPAIFSDASRRYVSSEELDELLRKKAIVAFRRSKGWVAVGHDEIRGELKNRQGLSWKNRKSLLKRRHVIKKECENIDLTGHSESDAEST